MSTSILNLFGGLFGQSVASRNAKTRRRSSQPRRTHRLLCGEGLERRELMTVSPAAAVAPAYVVTMSSLPSQVLTSGTATCTVTLNKPDPNGGTIELVEDPNDPNNQIAFASANINPGATSATITLTPTNVMGNFEYLPLGTGTIEAEYQSNSANLNGQIFYSAPQTVDIVYSLTPTPSPAPTPTQPVHTPPTITAPKDQTAVEGVAETVALGSFTDPNSGPWTVLVNWGDGSADRFSVTTPGTITAKDAFAEAGNLTATVTVTNSDNQSMSTAFHVNVAASARPIVTGVAPAFGLTSGGTKVTIEGTNLGTAGTAKVYFGSAPATILSDNGSTLVVSSPPGSNGVVNVTVATAGGTSAITPYDQFVYAAAPSKTNPSGVGNGMTYVFVNPNGQPQTIRYYDPPVSVGYDYQVTSGPNFSTIELPAGLTTTGYQLYLGNGKGGYQTTPYATLSGGVPFNLPSGVSSFRILGISTAANVDPTNPQSFETGLEFASQSPVTFTMTPIATPTLTGSASSPTVAQLNFTAVAGATGYLVQHEVNGQWQSYTFGNSTTLASNYTGCTINGLTPGASVNFRVGAVLPQGTIFSNTITVTQPAEAPVLSGSASSPTVAQLHFTAVAGATGYLVQHEVNGQWQSYTFGNSTTLASNYTSCTINGLTAGGSVDFRVGAITPQGTFFSNTISITQPADAPVLSGSASSATVAQLHFTAVAGATGYLVQREVNGQWQSYMFGNSTTLASIYTGCTINGLTPGASLEFRVGAITPQGTFFSNTITVTQPA